MIRKKASLLLHLTKFLSIPIIAQIILKFLIKKRSIVLKFLIRKRLRNTLYAEF